jgi:hypothetical protein
MSVQDVRLKQWDLGVFVSELIGRSLFPREITSAETNRLITPRKDLGDPGPLPDGTYHGSKLAATEMYRSIEQRYVVSDFSLLHRVQYELCRVSYICWVLLIVDLCPRVLISPQPPQIRLLL